MCVGFSFSLNTELNEQIKNEITLFEDELSKNGYSKEASYFYTANKSNIVELIVLLQKMMLKYEWFKRVVCLRYYRISERCNMQEITKC